MAGQDIASQAPAQSAGAREQYKQALQSHGARLTSQRLAILDAILASTEHRTADEILDAAQKIDPTVSRATVYRTLTLMVEAGLLRRLDLGRDFTYFDPNYLEKPHHSHLICLDCDKIIEFENPALESAADEIAHNLGFDATSRFVRLEGRCQCLKKTGSCPNRKAP
jgi:Fur family ferric uptake transcriptional regulator